MTLLLSSFSPVLLVQLEMPLNGAREDGSGFTVTFDHPSRSLLGRFHRDTRRLHIHSLFRSYDSARSFSSFDSTHKNKQTNKRSRVMMRFPRIVDTFLFIQSCVYVRKRPTGGKEWLGNSNAKAGQKHSCQLFLFRETSPR